MRETRRNQERIHERIHADRPRQLGAQLLFAVAFVLGAGAIILLRTATAPLVPGLEPSYSAALAAVLVLVAYALFGLTVYRNALEPDILGDNCYYLGFLFTLVSLAITLQAIDAQAGDASEIAGVIAGFGVALVSTITGIFLRIMLLQLRPSLAASEAEARSELIESVRAFRAQLTASALEFKDFSREMRQSLSEHHAGLHAAAQENAREFGDLSSEMTEALKVHHAGLQAAAQANMAEFQARLNDLIAATRHTVEAAVVRETETGLRAMIEAMTKGSSAFHGLGDSVAANASAFRETASGLERQLAEATAAIAHASGASSGAVADFEKSVASMSRSIGQITAHLAALDKQLADRRARRGRWWAFWRKASAPIAPESEA